MSETSTQAFNIKAYVNNLLSEKRELEAANNALEAEKSKLKQGVLKYGEIAKNLEQQNKEQQNKIQMLQRQIDSLQHENTKLSSTGAASHEYTNEIADTLLFAQRTAKQLVAEAEQRAAMLNQDTQKALNNMSMSVSQIRDVLRKIGNDVGLVEVHLESLKKSTVQEDKSPF